MNELSTKLYKVNFKYLIDNALDKKLWSQSWLIYDYDNFKITLCLNSILIREEKINLRLTGNDVDWSNNLSIPMCDEHYNVKVFSKSLFSSMLYLLQWEEDKYIQQHPLYLRAIALEKEQKRTLEKVAWEYCKGIGITDVSIINAYAKDYVEQNCSNFTSDVYWQLRYTLTSARYLMLAYQFEQDCPENSQNLITRVNDKLKELNHDTEPLFEQLEKALDLIEYEEMSNLSEALELVKEREEQ